MYNKRLSQNFLFDPSILAKIVEAGTVGPSDTVVEIGPGPGRLTAMLAGRALKVIAIELDRKLYDMLAEKFGDMEKLTLVHGDALRFPYESINGPFKVVANIPYHITTPLIFKLLEHRDRLLSMTLTVQKEVAMRVAAGPGSRQYGVLSVMVQYHGRARVMFTVPAGAFRPRPKVDSACLHVEVSGRPTVKVSDEETFFRVVRTAFSQRRKTLHNSLKRLLADPDSAFLAAGIEPGARPETLGMEQFARLSDEVYARLKTAEWDNRLSK